MYICQCFYTDKNGYTKNSVYQKKKFRPTDPIFFAYIKYQKFRTEKISDKLQSEIFSAEIPEICAEIFSAEIFSDRIFFRRNFEKLRRNYFRRNFWPPVSKVGEITMFF